MSAEHSVSTSHSNWQVYIVEEENNSGSRRKEWVPFFRCLRCLRSQCKEFYDLRVSQAVLRCVFRAVQTLTSRVFSAAEERRREGGGGEKKRSIVEEKLRKNTATNNNNNNNKEGGRRRDGEKRKNKMN